MLIVRSLRQDRVSLCVTSFIVNNLGQHFVEPPVLDMKAVSRCCYSHCYSFVSNIKCKACNTNVANISFAKFGLISVQILISLLLPLLSPKVVEESTCRTPLIFILSPGVDPTGALLQLAEASGMSKHFHALSLGQGQAPIAKSMIEEGVKNGIHPLLCFCSCPIVSHLFNVLLCCFLCQRCL